MTEAKAKISGELLSESIVQQHRLTIDHGHFNEQDFGIGSSFHLNMASVPNPKAITRLQRLPIDTAGTAQYKGINAIARELHIVGAAVPEGKSPRENTAS